MELLEIREQLVALRDDLVQSEAFIHDARHHLTALGSTIHDALTGPNDLCLKVSLLQDLNEADHKLRRALQ